MGIKIKINPTVRADLQEIRDYISQDNSEEALRIIRKIISQIENLAEFPDLGSRLTKKIKLRSKYRYIVCKPYLIFYIHEQEVATIYRILQGRRDIGDLLYEDSL